MLVINARLDVELQCLHWYSRVPSLSNLSDDPSRLKFDELEKHGFRRCLPCYNLTEVKWGGRREMKASCETHESVPTPQLPEKKKMKNVKF